MNEILRNTVDVNWAVATLLFVANVVGNFLVTSPPDQRFVRFEKLSIFPPFWVFGIWLVIWTVQAAMLYQSYGTDLWSAPTTFYFVLMCAGTLGSQLAGAKSWGAAIYLAFLWCMIFGAILFIRSSRDFIGEVPVLKAAGQLYLGWVLIALVVGTGVVLVCYRGAIKDSVYSTGALIILVAAPIIIWALWFKNITDYRIASVPFLMVLLALGIRTIESGGRFLKASE